MMASLQYFEIMDAVIHTKNKHTSKSEKNNARGVWKKMKKIPIMHISQKTMKQFLLKTIMWIPWYNHSIPITTQDYVYERIIQELSPEQANEDNFQWYSTIIFWYQLFVFTAFDLVRIALFPTYTLEIMKYVLQNQAMANGWINGPEHSFLFIYTRIRYW